MYIYIHMYVYIYYVCLTVYLSLICTKYKRQNQIEDDLAREFLVTILYRQIPLIAIHMSLFG